MSFKSIFSGIAKAEHSTVAWLEKELVAFENKAPAIEKVIDAGLSYIGPLLQMTLAFTGQEAAAGIVGKIVGQAQNDLKAASALVTDFGPTPTAASIFGAVEKNLQTLLTDAHVTGTQSVAAVTKVVNEVGVIGAAVGAAVTALGAAANPTPSTSSGSATTTA